MKESKIFPTDPDRWSAATDLTEIPRQLSFSSALRNQPHVSIKLNNCVRLGRIDQIQLVFMKKPQPIFLMAGVQPKGLAVLPVIRIEPTLHIPLVIADD